MCFKGRIRGSCQVLKFQTFNSPNWQMDSSWIGLQPGNTNPFTFHIGCSLLNFSPLGVQFEAGIRIQESPVNSVKSTQKLVFGINTPSKLVHIWKIGIWRPRLKRHLVVNDPLFSLVDVALDPSWWTKSATGWCCDLSDSPRSLAGGRDAAFMGGKW